MDISIRKSRKGTQLNNTYYFRQPLPRPREHMTLLCIISKGSKSKFSKYNLNSRKFNNTNKIHLHQSSKHIAMISYDHFNQNDKKNSLIHDHELMKNDNTKIENQNSNICYDSENIKNNQSEIENNTTLKQDLTSNKSYSTIIRSFNSEENKNLDDDDKKVNNEQEKDNNFENIIKKKENIENIEQPLKSWKENFHFNQNKLHDSSIENKMKSYNYKQQFNIDNLNSMKEKKKHLHIDNFEKISDGCNNNKEFNNMEMEKSWWRLIIEFFNFFTGKRDYNRDNNYKPNIKKFKLETMISAKPGYPDIYNAYRLSLGQNVTSDYRHHEDFDNIISKKILKRKKKKINNNQFNQKSKMRKMSSPLC